MDVCAASVRTGLINTARLAAGSASAGIAGELGVIAVCYIGSTSMRGGSGNLRGALIGAPGANKSVFGTGLPDLLSSLMIFSIAALRSC